MDGLLAMDESDATAAAASGDAAAAAAHDGMHSHGPPADDGAPIVRCEKFEPLLITLHSQLARQVQLAASKVSQPPAHLMAHPRIGPSAYSLA